MIICLIYDVAMVDVLAPRSEGAEKWRPVSGGEAVPHSADSIRDRVKGPSGMVRLKLNTQAFLQLSNPDVQVGGGISQSGSKIGESGPIVPQSFTEPIPVFIAPVVGEERI